MKYRTTFVTNSSSSSYICDICSECDCGRDLSIRDTNMIQCKNGHTLCQNHLKNINDIDLDQYDEDSGESFRSELPAKYCPICKFEKVASLSIVKYLIKTGKLDDITNEIKTAYDNSSKKFENDISKIKLS